MDVLEYKPKFDAAAIYAPIGFYEQPGRFHRPCDAERVTWLAGAVVGIKPMPSRARCTPRPRRGQALSRG
jgi:hypothetical protein